MSIKTRIMALASTIIAHKILAGASVGGAIVIGLLMSNLVILPFTSAKAIEVEVITPLPETVFLEDPENCSMRVVNHNPSLSYHDLELRLLLIGENSTTSLPIDLDESTIRMRFFNGTSVSILDWTKEGNNLASMLVFDAPTGFNRSYVCELLLYANASLCDYELRCWVEQ